MNHIAKFKILTSLYIKYLCKKNIQTNECFSYFLCITKCLFFGVNIHYFKYPNKEKLHNYVKFSRVGRIISQKLINVQHAYLLETSDYVEICLFDVKFVQLAKNR